MIDKIFDAILIMTFTGLGLLYILMTPYLPLGW